MPHTTFAVPLNFGNKVIPSGGGGYYYRADQNNGCDRWVVDIYMAVYANKGPLIDGQWFGPGVVRLGGGAYDLPSSSFYEGARPVTREDCERVSDSVIIYRKLATESQFTRVDYTSSKGKWMNNHCEFGMTNFFPSGYYDAPAGPMGGVDTYRVAVKVKERSSAQEAAVVISQPPPD
jgi:hypothetical protein